MSAAGLRAAAPADRTSRAKTSSARPDVQAALTVIGRRNTGFDTQPVDLTRANLANVSLIRANLGKASLYRADLGGAELREVDLTGAILSAANFSGATVRESNFSDAKLTGVKWPRDPNMPVPEGWTRNGPDSRLRRDRHQRPMPTHSDG